MVFKGLALGLSATTTGFMVGVGGVLVGVSILRARQEKAAFNALFDRDIEMTLELRDRVDEVEERLKTIEGKSHDPHHPSHRKPRGKKAT